MGKRTIPAGFSAYPRYVPSKITGDSGSADPMADGRAIGVTSAVNLATGLDVTSIHDGARLRIWFDTAVRYRLATWDEWCTDTAET